ncbi:ABC transporter ATP-binding protein [Thomasclavelia sp.]|uniref:ABC transporter ATP-binding protein n=1 Tax=Thomasclavelia sp. TaxID=3025757 RepID=UPI0025DA7475|nr:ABC transporter ATP-binding protein [Thomasclavelia sp.]
MTYAIEIKNLSKDYQDFSLKNINFNLPTGTIMGLIGENGAGKSTLINSILGIVACDYDELKYFDLDYQRHEKQIKEQIAVIFDGTHYNLEFTPKLIGKILSKTYRDWDMETYYQYLQRFDLPINKKLKKYSRGMKMKLEFAIAFSHQAKLLILDEATSGLDPIARDEILSLIREFTEDEEHTVLISSHITSDLDKIADYIAYIHQGKLVFIKSYEEINEEYGIINGNQELFTTLNQEDIVSYIKEPYSYSILVKNRHEILSVFTDLEIKRPSVEELMLFYVKGVK